ncbi:hypothetical protein [Streptomyces sp. Ac-502]|uniref:hypothetical protein n=1 Tax=Streptomyces sp. Ac-502 TaxID=3342801 RepID=UPI003862B4A5
MPSGAGVPVPLRQVLYRRPGIAEHSDPRCYLHIPENFSDGDAQIRSDLPASLAFSRGVVAGLVTHKLAWEVARAPGTRPGPRRTCW